MKRARMHELIEEGNDMAMSCVNGNWKHVRNELLTSSLPHDEYTLLCHTFLDALRQAGPQYVGTWYSRLFNALEDA